MPAPPPRQTGLNEPVEEIPEIEWNWQMLLWLIPAGLFGLERDLSIPVCCQEENEDPWQAAALGAARLDVL